MVALWTGVAMTHYIRHETASYRLTHLSYGFELVRKSDARSAFFQGDDAKLWDDNMLAIEKLEAENGWRAGNTIDKAFDFLCSGYDDVLVDG